uniref:Endonuclease/exonuclease/phosphatase domain-containing protein n=1 Tax=Photinus pyralis TaxID=7054 RepID=A0A1Y1KW25_PHOPY
MIGETHLASHTMFSMPNYTVYRTDRPLTNGAPARGGTAIMVHKRVVHQTVNLPNNNMEATGVEVKIGGVPSNIVAVYRSPRVPLRMEDIDDILSLKDPTIMAGDLNAKHPHWGSRSTNPAGNTLQLHSQQRTFEVVGPNNPTHIPYNPDHEPDIIDVTVLQALPFPYEI